MVSQVNLSSEASCRKAYLNYHCYGNTMNLTPQEMGEITSTWSNKLTSWQVTVNQDENEYEFDDADYEQYKNRGKQAGQAATGYEKNQGGDIGAATGHMVAGAGGAAVGLAASGTTTAVVTVAKEGAKAAGKTIGKGAAAAGKEAVKAAGQQSAANASSAMCIVGCVLSLATGVAYLAKNPNKEEKEACDKLQPEMAGAQGELACNQDEMAAIEQELIALSDEAAEINEEANEAITEQKTEYDLYKASYEAIKAKADSGRELTESEEMLFRTSAEYMQEAGVVIEETSADTTDEVGEINEEIGGYEENYDDIAESMGEVEGLTEYAGSFDKTAQTLCYVEGAAQTLNVASGTIAGAEAAALATSGAWAFGSTAWAYVFAAMGFAGAAMSGVGAAQQFKWAGEIGKEIEARGVTEELNTETMGVYDESIDGYDGVIQSVEELEMIIPNDIEAPDETELTGAAAASAQGGPQQAPARAPEAPTENTNKVKKKGNAGM